MGIGSSPSFSGSPGFLPPGAAGKSGLGVAPGGSPYFGYGGAPYPVANLNPSIPLDNWTSLFGPLTPPPTTFNTGPFGSGFLPGPGTGGAFQTSSQNRLWNAFHSPTDSTSTSYYNRYNLPDFQGGWGVTPTPGSSWVPTWGVGGFQTAGGIPDPYAADLYSLVNQNIGWEPEYYVNQLPNPFLPGRTYMSAGNYYEELARYNALTEGIADLTMPRNYSDVPSDYLPTDSTGRFNAPLGYFQENYGDVNLGGTTMLGGGLQTLPRFFNQSLGQYAGDPGSDYGLPPIGGPLPDSVFDLYKGYISQPGYGTVDIPEGARGTGSWAEAFTGYFPPEYAELGRALGTAGYGSEFLGQVAINQGAPQGVLNSWETLPSPSYSYDPSTGSVVGDPNRFVHYGGGQSGESAPRGSLSESLGGKFWTGQGDYGSDRTLTGFETNRLTPSIADDYRSALNAHLLGGLTPEAGLKDIISNAGVYNLLQGSSLSPLGETRRDLGPDRYFLGQVGHALPSPLTGRYEPTYAPDGRISPMSANALSGYIYNPLGGLGSSGVLSAAEEFSRLQSMGYGDRMAIYEQETGQPLDLDWSQLNDFYQSIPEAQRKSLFGEGPLETAWDQRKSFISDLDSNMGSVLDYLQARTQFPEYGQYVQPRPGLPLSLSPEASIATDPSMEEFVTTTSPGIGSGGISGGRVWKSWDNYRDQARDFILATDPEGASRTDIIQEGERGMFGPPRGGHHASMKTFQEYLEARYSPETKYDPTDPDKDLSLPLFGDDFDKELIYGNRNAVPTSVFNPEDFDEPGELIYNFGSSFSLNQPSILDRNDPSKWAVSPMASFGPEHDSARQAAVVRESERLGRGGVKGRLNSINGPIGESYVGETNRFTREMRNLLYGMASKSSSFVLDEAPDIDFARLMDETHGYRAQDEDGNFFKNPLDDFEMDVVPYVVGLPEHEEWTSLNDTYHPSWQGNTYKNFAVVRRFYRQRAKEWLSPSDYNEFNRTFDARVSEIMDETGAEFDIPGLSPNMADNFSTIGDPLNSSLVSDDYGYAGDWIPQYYGNQEGGALGSSMTPQPSYPGGPHQPVWANLSGHHDPFSFYMDTSHYGMAHGGMADSEAAVRGALASGDASGPDLIRGFIDKNGPESLSSIIDSVIDEGVPYSSRVSPSGIDSVPGGTADDIPALVDGKSPVRLSTGEYVIPADVVKGIGGGSSESGASRLMEMVDEVRLTRGGRRTGGAPN